MKKMIGLILLTSLLLLALILTFHSMNISHQKGNSLLRSYDLPLFSFQQKNGQVFTRDSLDFGKPTLVLHLSPSCGGCWEQLSQLQKLSASVASMQILIVSSDDWEELDQLQQWIQKNTPWQVAIVRDPFRHFDDFFGTNALPTVLCYNQQWALQKRFMGETKASVLKPHINKVQQQPLVSSYP